MQEWSACRLLLFEDTKLKKGKESRGLKGLLYLVWNTRCCRCRFKSSDRGQEPNCYIFTLKSWTTCVHKNMQFTLTKSYYSTLLKLWEAFGNNYIKLCTLKCLVASESFNRRGAMQIRQIRYVAWDPYVSAAEGIRNNWTLFVVWR